MVVSHHSTLLHFADGIAWLSLGQVRGEEDGSGMTSDVYKGYLQSICHQLGMDLPLCHEPIILRADSETIRRRKVRAAMEEAKVGMSHLLANKHVLIVLDDVWSRDAVSWLNFGNRIDSRTRVILSTRLKGGFGKAKSIEVGMLSVQEAVTLLVKESGHTQAELNKADQSAAIDIVTGCSLVPVAVCTAGRMLATKIRGFQQLAKDVSDAVVFDGPQHTMFNLLDRCFGGIGNEADTMKTVFVSIASIFTSNEGKRSLFPEGAAMKLIDALLLPEEKQSLARSGVNGTTFLLKRLEDFGLLDHFPGRN